MVHIPSFLVGSVTSGAGFLMIHRELSHRQLLSSRWILAEEAEQELTRLFEHAKATMNNTVRFTRTLYNHSLDPCFSLLMKSYQLNKPNQITM